MTRGQHFTEMITLHSARWLHPVLGEPIADGALLESDGRILAVDRRQRLLDTDHDQEQRWDGVLIPGLINAHTHLQYSQMADLGRGSYADFPEWATQFQQRFTAPDNDWRAAAVQGVAEAVAAGTTAIADVVTNPEALTAIRDGGVGGIAYWEVMAWPNARWLTSGRAQLEQLLDRAGDLDLGISPHAPYSLDEQVLADLAQLSRERRLRRHIHLAESRAEVEFVTHGTGPQAETLHRWGLSEFALLQRGGSGLSPVRYVDRLNGLGPDCHIAHGIYVDADDRALLRARDTVVALCPRSNAVIGLDEPPIAAYLQEGNRLAIGTDSLSSAPSLDLLADAAALAGIARSQGYRAADLHRRLLHAATLGGAQALGLDRRRVPAGALRPGWATDFAVLEIDPGGPDEVARAVVEDGAGRQLGTVIGGNVRWDSKHRSTLT